MATTFTGMYIVQYDDGQVTTISYVTDSITFSDTADGRDDHTVAVGDDADFIWNTVEGTMTHMGYVSCLGPVLSMNGAYYFFTELGGFAPGSVLPITDSHVLTLCFLGGTEVLTPAGAQVIEDLAIGDLVQTADGRAVPIRWIGRQAIQNLPWMPAAHEPVRISAHALGPNVPEKDLFVSPDHGMVIDDLVVNAGALVNGSTIRVVPQAELPDQFVYYHIETAAHDVISVNGAWAETFIDYAGRRSFDNYDEYLALYGCDRIIREQPRLRISAKRQLPDRLRRALGLPWERAVTRSEIAHWRERLSA